VDAALVPENRFHASYPKARSPACQRAHFPGAQLGQHRQQTRAPHRPRQHAYGQIRLGLDRPAADVSRGSSAHDILGVAAIVGVQSIEYQKTLSWGRGEITGEA